jgi:predicted dehydrogenase
MKMKKIRVGVVGCGFIASKWHIPGFQRLKNTVVRAVADVSPQLAASTAKKFNISKSYSNVTKMLQKEDLDIIDVCTPPKTHTSLAIEAMERGCHVLLEKPMALHLSECDELVDVSHKSGMKLCVVHNELFRPPMIRARKIVEQGTIGKVLGMQWCRFTHREEYLDKENHWIHKLPGGIIGETGPHGVYTSLAFLKKVNEVEVAAGNNLKCPWAPFDYFNITLEGEEMISNVIISHASKNYIADVSIFGTDGILKLDMQSMLLTHYHVRNTKPLTLAESSLKPTRQIIGGVISNAAKVLFNRNALMQVEGHTTEIELFVDRVVNNNRPPVTADEGREVIRVMEIIVQKFNQKYSGI